MARRTLESPWVRVERIIASRPVRAQGPSPTSAEDARSYSSITSCSGPTTRQGCPSCSVIADGFNGSVVHLANHDVTLCAVTRPPLPKLQAYKRGMGWSFPWASSFDSDFNYDFQEAVTKEQWESGAVEYNFRAVDLRLPEGGEENPFIAEITSSVGTDWPTYRRPLGYVRVARPRAFRSQRDWLLVAPPRRVRQPLTPAEQSRYGSTARGQSPDEPCRKRHHSS